MVRRLRRKNVFQFFLNEPIVGTQGLSVQCVTQMKIWLSRANIQAYLSPKGDAMLKLCNYKATTHIAHVFRSKVRMSTPFFGDETLIVCTRVLWVPAKPLTNVYFSKFFFAGNLDLRRLK